MQDQIEELRTLSENSDPLEINMTDIAKNIFAILRPKLMQLGLGGQVIEIAERRTVTYHGPDFFLEIIPRAHRLDLLLSLDFVEIDDPSGRAEDMELRNFVPNATRTGGVLLAMSDPQDLDWVMTLVKQSFESVALLNVN